MMKQYRARKSDRGETSEEASFREALHESPRRAQTGSADAAMLDYIGDMAGQLSAIAGKMGYGKLATLLNSASREAREKAS